MPVPDEILTPALSAVAGGLSVGWVAKMMITNWLKKHDAMADKVDDVRLQLTRIEVKVEALQRTEDRTQDQGRVLAVMTSKVESLEDDLNGIGRKVRAMETQ